MELSAAAQVAAFAAFGAIAVAGALGMTTTMSMFRSAVFLMASFLGVAGLFVLLAADLLGLLQVMMYVGGMLVMALFMVLFSHDPGGATMASMPLRGPERWFSAGLARAPQGHASAGSHAHGAAAQGHEGHTAGGHGHEGHPADDHGHEDHTAHGHGHDGHPAEDHGQEHGEGSHEAGHGGMDMSMSTPIKKPAAILALAIGAVLTALLLLRPAWPEHAAQPDPRSAERVGELLMGKYMVAFEGAGLMILLGIFGAAYLARPGRHPDPTDRQRLRAATRGDPVPVSRDQEDG